MSGTQGAPAPVPDEHSAAFWAALAEGRVVVQRCRSCERQRFPLMPACPYCGAAGGDEVTVTGAGTVYSFVRAHRALSPAMAGEVPYSVATVELDGGGRLVGRVEPPEAAAIGLRVEPQLVVHEGWTELRFRPEAP